MRTSLYAGLALAVFAGNAGAGTFYDVGVAGGQITSLSHDGRIAAGVVGGGAVFRWNKDRGAVPLSGFVSSYGMNSWAQPVAGAYTPDGDIANASAALAFSNSDLVGGPLVIGGFPGTGGGFGTGVSEAYGVSDNNIAVGLAYDEVNNAIAFRWTAAEGMTRLPVHREDTYSRANGISDNGRTVFGWNDQSDGFRSGVIWQNGTTLDLKDAGGNPLGEALAANAGGSVVVGAGYETANGSEAWRWTAATGAQPIGILSSAPATIKGNSHARYKAPVVRSERAEAALGSGPNGFFPPAAYAFAVSNDGNTIVGATGVFPQRHAFIWTPSTGMQLLSDYAAAHGVTIPAGWDLNTADAISADGKTIAGWGFGPSSVGSFVIDLHDDTAHEGVLEARGTVAFNNLSSGPFAGVPTGTTATLKFRMSPDGFEIEPGEDTRYPIELDTFELRAGTATETLVATAFGPNVDLTNDYPLSDGIHLFSTPTASGQAFEFEMFNPGGNLFDSDDLARVNRTFGPQFFEKTSWLVSAGDEMMYVDLQWVRISEFPSHPTTHH